jgi:hypothetical protein
MIDRRAIERYRLTPSAPARISTAGHCQVIDLSEGGALIRHDFELEEAKRVFLDVEVPSGSILVESRIVWTSATEDGYLSGVRFQPAGAALQHVIRELVATERAIPAPGIAVA